MPALTESATLHNGLKIPRLGLGTWRITDGQPVIDAIHAALDIGYRHIDTAAVYGNEKGVGQAIRSAKTPRDQIFITTKIWNDAQRSGPAAVRKAFDESFARLDVGPIDLLLLHWAVGKYVDNWKVLEELYAAGKVKAIGLSNFMIRHLQEVLAVATVAPMVNQVELHPRLLQPDLLAFCQKNHIVQEAWSPLMQGRLGEIPGLQAIADRYHKTLAQLVLRWNLQHDLVTIPKSTRPERLRENAAIFDFQITPQDMAQIDAFDKNTRVGADPNNCPF